MEGKLHPLYQLCYTCIHYVSQMGKLINHTTSWITATTTTTTTVLRPFVRDYLGEPVPEETFAHSPILIIIQPLSASFTYYNP